MRRKQSPPNPFEQSYLDGASAALRHRIFAQMGLSAHWREDPELSRDKGWARVHADGSIVVNRNARLEAQEWVWVITHCALHVGFGHLEPDRSVDPAARAAACVGVTRFQQQLRLGTPPLPVPADLPGSDESRLADLWRVTGVPGEMLALGCGGTGPDHLPGPRPHRPDDTLSWTDRFAIGLASAAGDAVYQAGETRARQTGEIDPDNPWEQARRWFVTAFPLLGALASGFRIVADADLARSWQISVAAVDPELAEIYVTPLRKLSPGERRFVLAHEMLHAALRHCERVGPRDPYLWNVAADFVINGWLVEMGVGEMPEDGLYDPALRGRGTEDVYDEITKNLRRYRKLATLRGRGMGDMMANPLPGAHEARRAGDLDDFYRRALLGGLSYHDRLGRGLLPAGLVDEIRVLEHPPPPWDVQLAQWFDRYFTPIERTRSFARPSRRQASTPDIPRPGWIKPEILTRERTFGVVLDTSGSMDHALLGKALGAIASYAVARDVPAARVVFCDAVAYDAGYLAVEEIAGRVRVRGRGGTRLQPGIVLLEQAGDFPPDGPILIITDGRCDVLRVRRAHAYLIPKGASLPFGTRAEIFRIS
jgi:predicted metal-dependent peptidase